MAKNKIINQFVGCLSLIIILSGGVIMKELAKSSFRNKIKNEKVFKNFDDMYEQMLEHFSKEKIIEVYYEILAKKTAEAIKNDFAKDNVVLSQDETLLLQKNLETAILEFDYISYFRNKKDVFLKNMNMTEDELLNKVNSIKNKEDLMVMNKKFRIAMFALGYDMWQEEHFKKAIENSLQEIINNRKLNKNKADKK